MLCQFREEQRPCPRPLPDRRQPEELVRRVHVLVGRLKPNISVSMPSISLKIDVTGTLAPSRTWMGRRPLSRSSTASAARTSGWCGARVEAGEPSFIATTSSVQPGGQCRCRWRSTAWITARGFCPATTRVVSLACASQGTMVLPPPPV